MVCYYGSVGSIIILMIVWLVPHDHSVIDQWALHISYSVGYVFA